MKNPSPFIMQSIIDYVSYACFDDRCAFQKNPYYRPISTELCASTDFFLPITTNELDTEKNKLIHQLLFSMYEQDMLFMDLRFFNEEAKKACDLFYNPNCVSIGRSIKPHLEYLAFDFLTQAVYFPTIYDSGTLKSYLTREMDRYKKTENVLCVAISQADDPRSALQQLVIQMAPDFLAEASPLARTVLGSFGEEQSEMMKVLIDEYGYGVHRAKHSTLFENLMKSIGLSDAMHDYYDNYSASSLMVINYFHYLTTNKLYWFRYLGALYYTETSIPNFNRELSQLMKRYFIEANTQYFDEHAHIDIFHSRMVLDNMIMQSLKKYQVRINDIIAEILSGFESARWIANYADNEFIKKIVMGKLCA